MLGFFKRRADGSPSVEQQLATLVRCGIGLVPGVTAKDLMAEFPREDLETDPFRLLLVCMGGPTEAGETDGGTAHVAFTLAGRGYRWEAEVKDDWVDAGILSRFADLLARTGKGRRFTYIDLGGQDCLIGCATQAEQDRLAKETGLKVQWLT